MATTKLGLPTVTSNMSADVPRDLNALAEAVDAVVASKAELEATSMAVTAHSADYIAHPKYVASTGTANTYVINPSPAISAYGEGQGFVVKINAENTGASTINVNSKGAKSIVNAKGNPLPAGTLKANSVYSIRYNGTSFILQGEGGELSDLDLSNFRTAVIKNLNA